MFRLNPLYAFLAFNFIAILTAQMLGPVDLIYKRIEQCDPPSDNIIEFGLKKWKVNRTTEELNITFSTPYTIDDTVMVTLNASMKKEGGWKPGAMYYENTLCKAVENMLGDTFREFLSKTGNEKCPVPEGTYIINNFYINNDHFTVPQVYGEYKMVVTVIKTIDDIPEVQACYVLYYNFDPKQR